MIFYPDQFVGMSKAEIKERLEVTFEFAGERNAPDSLVDSLFEGSQKSSTKAVEDINLKPTEAMANAAKRGLKLRKEHGRGGTEVGVARARDISNRKDLSPSTVKRMKSFFARHEVDLDAPAAKEGNEGYPSAGLIAWLLWGGDPGKTWSESKVEAIDRESGKKNLKSGDNCGTGAGGFSEGNTCATGSSAQGTPADRDGNELSDAKGRAVKRNPDGTISLYHGTTKEGAEAIARDGFISKENTNEAFFSTSEKGTKGYGDGTIVEVRVNPEKTRIDDVFEASPFDFMSDEPNLSVAVKVGDIAVEDVVPHGTMPSSRDNMKNPGSVNTPRPDGFEDDPQTNEGNFKEWFGDGPTHSDGHPIQFYHGTKKSFEEFATGQRIEGSPYFLTTDPKFAGNWPEGTGGLRGPFPEVLPSVERINKLDEEFRQETNAKIRERFPDGRPDRKQESARAEYDDFVMSAVAESKERFRVATGFRSRHDAERMLGIRVMPVYAAPKKTFYPPRDYKKVEGILAEIAKETEGVGKMVEDGGHKFGNWFIYERDDVVAELKRQGYDGIWITETLGHGNHDHTTLALWDPKLVKSSIGNSGQFDPNDPNITKSADNCGTGAGGFSEGNVCATGSSASENAANLPNNLQEFWEQVHDSNEWRGMPVVEGGDSWTDSEGLEGKHEVDDSTRQQAFQAASEMQVEDVNLYTGIGFRTAQQYARDPNALDDRHADLKKTSINVVQTMDTLTQRRISLDNENHILHRGMRVPLPDSTAYKPEKLEWINKVLNSKVGDKLKPKGFLSTTDNFGTARSFAYRPREKETAELVFTIEAKRGLPLSNEMTQYISEKEVVLPRNGSFTVVGKEIVKNAPDIQSPQVDRSNASPIIHIRLRQDDE